MSSFGIGKALNQLYDIQQENISLRRQLSEAQTR